jgi:hypothetical protein
MNTQTPAENKSPIHAAQGNLAFLLSVIRCGESLSAVEEANARKVIKDFDAMQLPAVGGMSDEVFRQRALEEDSQSITAGNPPAAGGGPVATHPDMEAFWTALENGWEIEPRSYFETEAPKNGFGSPLAMAVHYLW